MDEDSTNRRCDGMKPERQELQEVYYEMLSLQKVADFYGVSKKSILNWMNLYNIKRFKRRTYKDLLIPIRRYIDHGGYTAKEVASMLDIDQTSLNKALRMIGKAKAFDAFHKGYHITHNGYRQIRMPSHPHADSIGYVKEHRLVMEDYLGRYLESTEVVHHIDEDKLNNSIDNLELCLKEIHTSYHHKDMI